MFDIEKNLQKLPDSPGVYLHKDRLGKVIYVGKAISLKKRVRQYFQSYGQSTPKLRALVDNIAEFDYITCATEMEALILENNLIKKHMPKYNVLLRDDKTYPYICVTLSEDYPRVLKTRRFKKRDNNKYFGPYSDAGAVNTIVDLLNDLFTLKRCSKSHFNDGERPCLNYHIEKCRGICKGEVDKEDYDKAIRSILDFLSGKTKPIEDLLKKKMREESDNLRFEEAAKYRDYLLAIKELEQTQRVTIIGGDDMDVVLPVRSAKQNSIAVFSLQNGKLIGRDTFPMQAEAEDASEDLTGAFIKQYYSKWADLPDEILVEKLPKDVGLLEDFLSSGGHKVRIFTPKRGEKYALLKMAKSDRDEMVGRLEEREKNRREKKKALSDKIGELMTQAGYERKPSGEDYRVEAYDISNTNGVDSVGAMVVFKGSRKIPKDYRLFKIRTVEGPDDYGSLQEMVYRRFRRADKGDPAFSTLPDILFIDGGLGQVSAVRKVLQAMEKDIAVMGLAKDDSHRTRALVFANGYEIELKNHPILFRYVGGIQEEVHRYAISYHHNLRGRRAISSVLDEIDGIGEVRRNALLTSFGSVDAIKKADLKELEEVPSMTKKAAQNVKDFFSGKNERLEKK